MPKDNEKVVTIRGINESYYKSFQSLTKLMKLTVGSALSELISHYKKPMPSILGNLKMKHQFIDSFSDNLEIIDGQKELTISKNDLLEVGDKTKFFFNEIESLVLDDSITDDLIIKYIYRIINSNVQCKGKISKLLLYSLQRSNKPINKEKNLKEITIRNVNASAYDEFVASCQLHNQTIGEALNELWSQYLPEAELMFILTNQIQSNVNDLLVITNMDNIIVTEKELLELGVRKVLFHRINQLIFEEDVTKESFQKYVIGIYNCEPLTLPVSIPKLIGMSRTKSFP